MLPEILGVAKGLRIRSKTPMPSPSAETGSTYLREDRVL
jgi:hypothetical protein